MLTSIFLVLWWNESQIGVHSGEDGSGTGWPVMIPLEACDKGSMDRCGGSSGDNEEEGFFERWEK